MLFDVLDLVIAAKKFVFTIQLWKDGIWAYWFVLILIYVSLYVLAKKENLYLMSQFTGAEGYQGSTLNCT